MSLKTFNDTLTALHNGEITGSEKKDVIIGFIEDWDVTEWQFAMAMFDGDWFTDIGLGKRSVIDAVTNTEWATFDVSDAVEEKGTVTAALLDSHDDRKSDSLEELKHNLTTVGRHSGDRQKQEFERVLEGFTHPAVVTYAVLNDLSTGISGTTVKNAVLEEYTDLTGYEKQKARGLNPDAALLARDVVDDALSLQTEPIVELPFETMLAKREKYLDDLLDSADNIAVEPKLDGNRCQIHIRNGGTDVWAYSRRLNDVTDSLPELRDIDWPPGDYILDCEVVANESYAETSSLVGSNQSRELGDGEAVFHVFDILHVSGEDLMPKTYDNRRSRLERLRPLVRDHRVQVVPVFYSLDNGLDSAAKHGYEGVIVKDRDSPYVPGGRPKSWVKKKLTVETADLRIADFAEGKGENAGTLGKVALETADGQHVGWAGSGFTDEQRDEIWSNTDEYFGRTIEVRFEGIGSQGKLRFPTFKRFRPEGQPDSWDEVQDIAEVID